MTCNTAEASFAVAECAADAAEKILAAAGNVAVWLEAAAVS